MYIDCLKIAIVNIRNRKLRTGLTVIGIIIGIATIFALISIGNGLDNGVQEQFGKIGANRLYVSASGSGLTSLQTGLTNDDVKTLESMAEFKWVTAYLQEQAIVEYDKESHYVAVWGITSEDLEKRWEDMDINLEQGRYFTENEKYSAILGIKASKDMFDREIRINENIIINEKRFKVVGIFEEIGNPEDDSMIQIPIDVAQEIFNKEDQITIVELVLKEGIDVEEAAKKTERFLKRKRGDDLFEIITPDQIMQQFSTVMSIVNIILISIAGISIVVGGIGIMNSTFTSVLERTKEIGIMKAIGAQNKHILFLFLIEASIVGLIGGVIGITIGFSIGKLAQVAAESAGFNLLRIKLDPLLTLFSLFFAVGIGALAGYLPAKEATKKQVVVALRGK